MTNSKNQDDKNVKLDHVVRQCCKNCLHSKMELEQDENFGIYEYFKCKNYADIVNTFPHWLHSYPVDLIVNPIEINLCKHYKQKQISSVPLFETKATSA